MPAVGRNDRCPCGSGKKYKRCCLAKDEAAARLAREQADRESASHRAGTPPEPTDVPLPFVPQIDLPELSPEQEAAEAAWERFDVADYEGRVAVFLQSIADGIVTSDVAGDMLSDLHGDARERDDLSGFSQLVARFQAEAPDLYREEEAYCSWYLIEDDLLQGRDDRLKALLEPFAEGRDDDLHVFFRLIDLLCYHGRAGFLLDVMRRAWPSLQRSGDLMPWATVEYREVLVSLLVLDYLKRTPAPAADDPALLADLAPYVDVKNPGVAEDLRTQLGLTDRRWDQTAFTKPMSKDAIRRNLLLLSLEWGLYASRRCGVPLERADLARRTLVDYLLERLDEGKRGPDLLVPERRSLDRHLVGLISLLNLQVARAGAAAELAPAFLIFLVERALITPAKAAAAKQGLMPIGGDMAQALRALQEPGMAATVERAWQGT